MGILAAIGSAIAGAVGEVGAALGTVGSFVGGGVAGALGGGALATEIGGGIGTAITGGLEGAGLGALEAAATGGKILKGAEFGAISGGVAGGLGPELGTLTGSTAVGDTIAGALGGAAGGAATHQNVLTSALEGGAGGFLRSQIGAKPSAGAPSAAPASAAGTAAPSSVVSSPDATVGTAVQSGLDLNAAGPGGTQVSAAGSLPGDFTTNTGASPGSVGTGAAGGGGASSASGFFSAGTPATAGNAPITSTAPDLSGASTVNPATASGYTPNSGAAAVNGAAKPAGGLTSVSKYLPVAALGMDLLQGNKQPAYFGNLASDAARLQAQGAQMEGYLTGGTLPPGMQAGITSATNDAAATIRGEYASRGMSGSSAEQQDLANLQMRTQAQGAEIATQLFQSGVSETAAADQLHSELMQVQMQQDQNLSTAIGRLAGSFATMGQPLAAAA